MELIIDRISSETDRIAVFHLSTAAGTVPKWTPGAHLTFDLGEVGTRSYSLISWPQADDGLTIAVQAEPDGQGGSLKMHGLKSGDTVQASGPKNDFELGDHAGPAMLLAGGIGVTPLISMATSLQAAGRAYHFHYAARSASVMGFRESLRSAFGDNLNFYFDDEEPLNLRALFSGIDPATHLYVCGPKGMIEAARMAANAAGLPDAQIHFELFANEATLEGDTSFEVEVASTGDVYTIPPGRTIVEVLEEAGLDLMYDCQRGDCGICQTDVLEGIPDHRDVVLSDAEKAENKVMQICVSRAKSSRLVLDL